MCICFLLISLIREPIYPSLRDHPRTLRYPDVKGLLHNVFFWDHDHKEGGQDENKSKFNTLEVEMALGLARWVHQCKVILELVYQ
jgi:hypothetical protein